MPTPEVHELEQWFVARGAPNLIEDYRQRVDLRRRARPWLILATVVEVVVGVGDLDTAWWQNAIALAVAFAVLGLATVLRAPTRELAALVRRAPLLPELAAFVLLSPALTATVGDQPGQAAIFMAANLVIIGLVVVAAGFGLVAVVRWAAGKAAREIGAAARLLARALPLLLLIQIVLFINTEMWQVADGLDGLTLGVVVGMFVGTGAVFLITRLPRELDELATFTSADEVRACVAGTPAEGAATAAKDLVAAAQPLSARQRLNVALVALFSQGLQITLVTLLVGAFFVVFGVLTITPEIIDSWLDHRGDELFRFDAFGRDLHVTAELLKISTFLAAFSGLYFTVVLVTDETYRQEFRKEILDELRQTFAVRVVYLAMRARARGPSRRPSGR